MTHHDIEIRFARGERTSATADTDRVRILETAEATAGPAARGDIRDAAGSSRFLIAKKTSAKRRLIGHKRGEIILFT